VQPSSFTASPLSISAMFPFFYADFIGSKGKMSRDWLEDVRLEDKTKTYYRDGWRLLKMTTVAEMRLDQITSDSVERLKFSGRNLQSVCNHLT
jgi:hypothetical protein